MRILFDTLLESYDIDPNIIDLVLWFPYLSWEQFAAACAGVLAWMWVCDRVFKILRAGLRGCARLVAKRVFGVVPSLPGKAALQALLRWLRSRSVTAVDDAATAVIGFSAGLAANSADGTATAGASQPVTAVFGSWREPYRNSGAGNLARARRMRVHHHRNSRPYGASAYRLPLSAGGRSPPGGMECPLV